MITLEPVRSGLVPRDSEAAAALSAPNYDEFQGDVEIWRMLQERPECVLRITMAHCDARSVDEILAADSEPALERAAANMRALASDPRVAPRRDFLWVYEITSGRRPGTSQIGVGGMARTSEIRTEQTPDAPIIRNEGVREPKARGRARLIERTRAIIGMVNNAVDDANGALERALRDRARASDADLQVTDEAGNRHRIWLSNDRTEVEQLRALLAAEPRAYVADGNHRSAAAAMLGYDHFLSVFFPASTLHIEPYNRLVRGPIGIIGNTESSNLAPGGEGAPVRERLRVALDQTFDVDPSPGERAFQPGVTHEIGLYDGTSWCRLRPRRGTFDGEDAARDIDADIVQRLLFADILGIADPRDERLTFVGGNRDALWLQDEVDQGRAALAVTLPPVTMAQFIRVCEQGRLMPPKSTWFDPKVRSGLVVALL